MSANQYQPHAIYLDPFNNRDYFYSALPILPWLFHRIYVYYPSDYWVINHCSRADADTYRSELLYWIEQQVIRPVVKDQYPFEVPTSHPRLKVDSPSPKFINDLKRARTSSECSWLILPRDFTEQGLDSANTLIREHGEDSLLSELNVQLDESAIPEFAVYFSKNYGKTKQRALLETIAGYDNDDIIRKRCSTCEYLLPFDLGAQYARIQMLRNKRCKGELTHNAMIVKGSDRDRQQRREAFRAGWYHRNALTLWRQHGYHNIMREFLLRESCRLCANGMDALPEQVGECLSERLDALRSSVPGELASLLQNQNVVTKLSAALCGLAGFLSIDLSYGPWHGLAAGGAAAYAGAAAGSVIGHVGTRRILSCFRTVAVDRLLAQLCDVLREKHVQAMERCLLAFADVTIFGRRPDANWS